MKVAAFLFYTLWLWGSGVFCVHKKTDIHWIENIQGLFNKVTFSHSLPAVYILYLVLCWGKEWFYRHIRASFPTTGTVQTQR